MSDKLRTELPFLLALKFSSAPLQPPTFHSHSCMLTNISSSSHLKIFPKKLYHRHWGNFSNCRAPILQNACRIEWLSGAFVANVVRFSLCVSIVTNLRPSLATSPPWNAAAPALSLSSLMWRRAARPSSRRPPAPHAGRPHPPCAASERLFSTALCRGVACGSQRDARGGRAPAAAFSRSPVLPLARGFAASAAGPSDLVGAIAAGSPLPPLSSEVASLSEQSNAAIAGLQHAIEALHASGLPWCAAACDTTRRCEFVS